MWILESNGDFLQGKRMWLKPGKSYLFGRVKKDGVLFAIDHKTVSRKHFIITVDDVKEGDVARIHSRTKVTITDQNSKSGTSVNGELLKGQGQLARELKSAENSVRPGNCPHELVIHWEPCVLTFNMMKKELKAGALKPKQDRVKDLDIKAIADFVPDNTTHLVVNKRNTPKGLQALIYGKYLVSESFLDALDYAATPGNLDDEENLSPLEEDFDNAWPISSKHLPPPGREPTIRPVESYEPDPNRANIFENYTFVFGDQTQYDNLLPVIASGHGKALLMKINNGETTVDEAIQFTQNAAGRKGFGTPQDSSEQGGAVIVRWNPKNEFEDWTSNLINQVALKLDQRAIDQAEFLDSILANDASLLKQSIPHESTNEGRIAPPPSAAASLAPTDASHQKQSNGVKNGTSASRPIETSFTEDTQNNEAVTPALNKRNSSVQDMTQAQAHASASAELPSRSGRPARYRLPPPTITQTNFDDGFDPDAIVPYDDDDDEDDEPSVDMPVNGDSQLSDIKVEHTSESKKRNRSLQDSFDDDIDELLPAATAMKRRKLMFESDKPDKLQATSANGQTRAPKKKKKEKEIDVREVVKAQREKEIEAAKRDQEDLEEILPYDHEDKGPANLAVIVQMDLPVRQTKVTGRKNPEDDPRWDPKWNGRKNFKKFRPQGEGEVRRNNHSTKVIVPLVEYKRNTGGLGEKYWEKSQEEKEREKRKKAKSQRSQFRTPSPDRQVNGSGSAAHHNDDSDVEETGTAHRTSPEASRLQQEAAEILHHDIDPDSPRSTRSSDRHGTQTQIQSQVFKRPAPKGPSGGAKKKQKILPVTVIHGSGSDDDSDDMKFKFGSRARRAKANA